MKQTPAERDREEERAWRKAQKAARKARRHSDDPDRPSKHKRKRSRSPSSRHKKKREVPPFSEYQGHDLDDEGWVPPPSSSKADLDALRAEMEERRFREKLFDAMGDDAGFADTEARFNEYDDYIPSRWREDRPRNRDDPSTMEDDEYAEWVREGMWKRTHRAEVEAQERAEEERKRKKEKQKARKEETRRMEQEDNEKRARRRQVKEQQSIVDAWTAYDTRWTQLRAGPASAKLSFTDLAWPCHPLPILPLGPDALSKEVISSFLLSPLHSVGKPRKQRLREALLLYHPDRFVAKWMGLVREKDAPGVQEAVGRVARALTALVEEGDQGK